ncbi:hypothetical protein Dvina_03410 [Dactylosporangium vinaceum]|uniref:Uncharacterized protein n=1 Tax=Dactylosporangium vinaceum TaxID=53362 RepID=A0ABV5M0V5_9ACTN|nr:hypothetical protein [Dactylosporangium vinaceum]UAB97252.1 hypothetical protein Dvina_03410 [Dactylosporangium vinaceum]
MSTETTTKSTTRKIPTPLYAAAGAGDLAYEQLRKLPAQVAQLRARVEEFRPAVADAGLRSDLNRLSDVARRNAATFLATAQQGAQVAQDRALAVYTGLVARGEKVVSTARGAEAKVELEPASKEVTALVSTTGEADPAEVGTPAAVKKTAAKKVAPKK